MSMLRISTIVNSRAPCEKPSLSFILFVQFSCLNMSCLTLYSLLSNLTLSCMGHAIIQRTVYIPATLDAAALLSLKRSEVFVCKPPPFCKDKKATFYKYVNCSYYDSACAICHAL